MISSPSRTALKKRLLSQALKDPLFRATLADTARHIAQESASAPNEATIASIFESNLYAALADIGVSFKPIKESPVASCRHTAKGRTDSRLGNLVIEFKQPATLSTTRQTAVAEEQLSNYLQAISADTQTAAVGWLIDGTRSCEIRCNTDGTLTQSAYQAITGDTLLRLTQQIVALEQSALTSPNLIKDFCGDLQGGIIFRLARDLVDVLGRGATLKSEMLKTEWEELFRLAHDDRSQQKRVQERRKTLANIFNHEITTPALEYQSLFCLHTAYAIVLKLIAYRVVCDVKFNAALQDFKSLATADSDVLRAFCASLEDGEIFRQIGILNLLEGDFFSWYADEKQWHAKLSGSIAEVVQTLARYEDAKTIFTEHAAIDLFRSLYEAAVPQAIRSGFGEFYTPQWLAEHVISTAGFEPGNTLLDPCCGSGTFVIAAIGRLKKSGPISASDILHSIAGVDLNPLAVLTARIHYFIHIVDALEAENLQTFVIPIFLGDASNVPTIKTEEGIDFFFYQLKTLKTPVTIHVPVEMCRDFTAFVMAMFRFEALIHEKSYGEAKDFLVAEAYKSSPAPITRKRVGELADQLIELERKEWNGIWTRIITNFIATAQLGKFDRIVGNPPWIDWKSLPSGYREKIKDLCIDKGLFSGAGRTGGINLNICALITHVAATNWLTVSGRLAFLMPKELINQASYEGWRDAVGGTQFSLIRLDDWSRSGHPFDPVKEDFMTFLFEKSGHDQSKLPVYAHEKMPGQSNLITTRRCAGQLVTNKTVYTIAANAQELEKFRRIAGECSYIGREGIEFYPQELMIFRFDGTGPRHGTAWFRNIQVNRSKYKIPEQRVLLETKYMFPLVKGPGIGRFQYDDPDWYVSFPYEKSDPHRPINQTEFKRQSPLLHGFYRKFQQQFEQQTAYSDAIRRGGEFYGVARTGPYSFHDCYVAYRDNTKWRAAVIQKKQCPWGENKRFLFQNHAVSVCERRDGGIISVAEAWFVAGILNTPIVENFIYASSDNRSFKIRVPVHVPLFDPANLTHQEISRLAQHARNADAGAGTAIMQRIEQLYLTLL